MKKKGLRTKLLPILMLFISLILAFSAKAQVTIGSGEEPVPGSLLQLKNKTGITGDNINATKGLAFPRVNLSDRAKLYPMFLKADNSGPTDDYTGSTDVDAKNAEHTGLMVYNMYTSDPAETDPNLTFKEGFYHWDGTQWRDIGEGSSGGGGSGASSSGCGGIIPFSSGIPISLVAADVLNLGNITGTDAGTITLMQTIGFGVSAALDIDLLNMDVSTGNLTGTGNSTILNSAFTAPRNTTLESFYASMDVTAAINSSLLNSVMSTLDSNLLLQLLGFKADEMKYSLNAILYGETAAGSNIFQEMGNIPLLLEVDTDDGTQDGIVPFNALAIKLSGHLSGHLPNGANTFENNQIIAGHKYVLAYRVQIISNTAGAGLIDAILDIITNLLSVNATVGYASAGISLACADGDGSGGGGTGGGTMVTFNPNIYYPSPNTKQMVTVTSGSNASDTIGAPAMIGISGYAQGGSEVTATGATIDVRVSAGAAVLPSYAFNASRNGTLTDISVTFHIASYGVPAATTIRFNCEIYEAVRGTNTYNKLSGTPVISLAENNGNVELQGLSTGDILYGENATAMNAKITKGNRYLLMLRMTNEGETVSIYGMFAGSINIR